VAHAAAIASPCCDHDRTLPVMVTLPADAEIRS
jgi:hypothetical protein